jgi:hypothetical protein
VVRQNRIRKIGQRNDPEGGQVHTHNMSVVNQSHQPRSRNLSILAKHIQQHGEHTPPLPNKYQNNKTLTLYSFLPSSVSMKSFISEDVELTLFILSFLVIKFLPKKIVLVRLATNPRISQLLLTQSKCSYRILLISPLTNQQLNHRRAALVVDKKTNTKPIEKL